MGCCVARIDVKYFCRQSDLPSAVTAMAKALHWGRSERDEIMLLAASYRTPSSGLFQRMSRFPGRLMRGGDPKSSATQDNHGAQGEQSNQGKESIAKEWVHFLMVEADIERDQSRHGERGHGSNLSAPDSSAQNGRSEHDQQPLVRDVEMNGAQLQSTSDRHSSVL
jgi:hypothetical protein